MRILGADIGGTQSRFGLFDSDGRGLSLRQAVVLRTSEAGSFDGLLKNLSQAGLKPSDADIFAIGVAGPVRDGNYCLPPNIGWEIDLSHPERLGIGRFVIVNDFAALAHACLSPIASTAREILPGTPDASGGASGTIAVVGAGTGFGKAALVPHRAGYAVMASEGGHAAFPFTATREHELSEFIRSRTGVLYVTLDDIVTGRGFSMLHWFLTGQSIGPMELHENLSGETLAWAARLYARAARDFALDVLATGGLYIAGGIAARAPELLTHPEFEREFRSSAKHAALLASIRVSLLEDELAGLWGAGHAGLVALGEV